MITKQLSPVEKAQERLTLLQEIARIESYIGELDNDWDAQEELSFYRRLLWELDNK